MGGVGQQGKQQMEVSSNSMIAGQGITQKAAYRKRHMEAAHTKWHTENNTLKSDIQKAAHKKTYRK
jgi:hypothetical protein